MEGRDTLIGSTPRALRAARRPAARPRVDAAGSTVASSDGDELDVGAVIWATGFRAITRGSTLPVFDEARPARPQARGDRRRPGLYFLGLTWQHTRGSALLGWVKDDAEHLAQQIDAFAAAERTARRRPSHRRRHSASRTQENT